MVGGKGTWFSPLACAGLPRRARGKSAGAYLTATGAGLEATSCLPFNLARLLPAIGLAWTEAALTALAAGANPALGATVLLKTCFILVDRFVPRVCLPSLSSLRCALLSRLLRCVASRLRLSLAWLCGLLLESRDNLRRSVSRRRLRPRQRGRRVRLVSLFLSFFAFSSEPRICHAPP